MSPPPRGNKSWQHLVYPPARGRPPSCPDATLPSTSSVTLMTGKGCDPSSCNNQSTHPLPPIISTQNNSSYGYWEMWKVHHTLGFQVTRMGWNLLQPQAKRRPPPPRRSTPSSITAHSHFAAPDDDRSALSCSWSTNGRLILQMPQTKKNSKMIWTPRQ